MGTQLDSMLFLGHPQGVPLHHLIKFGADNFTLNLLKLIRMGEPYLPPLNRLAQNLHPILENFAPAEADPKMLSIKVHQLRLVQRCR